MRSTNFQRHLGIIFRYNYTDLTRNFGGNAKGSIEMITVKRFKTAKRKEKSMAISRTSADLKQYNVYNAHLKSFESPKKPIEQLA